MATKRPASSEPEPDEEQVVVEKEVEKREGEGKEVVEGKDGEGKKISEGGAVEAQEKEKEKEKEQGVKIPKSKRPKTLATKTKRPTVEEEGKKEKEKEKVEEVVVKSPKSKKSKTHVTATKQPTTEGDGQGEKVDEVVVKSPDKKSKTQPQTKQPTAEVEGNGEELKKPKAQLPKTKQPTTEKTLPIDLTKKKRKEKDDGDSVVEEKEAKKKKALPFRRVWSEEDEVSILKGYLEHIKEGGDMNGLFDSIKMSLNAVDFSKEQLNDKVRKMKKKCLENAKKEEQGVALEFSKPHDSELYELSKKLWNPGKGVDSAGQSAVKRSSWIRKAAAAGDTPTCVESVDEKEKEKEPISVEFEDEKKQEQIVVGAFNLLNELMHSEKGKDLIRPPLSLGEGFLGLGWVGKSEKVKAMDEKWKNLKIAEGEVFLEKLALMKERTELGLEALRGSSYNA